MLMISANQLCGCLRSRPVTKFGRPTPHSRHEVSTTQVLLSTIGTEGPKGLDPPIFWLWGLTQFEFIENGSRKDKGDTVLGIVVPILSMAWIPNSPNNGDQAQKDGKI